MPATTRVLAHRESDHTMKQRLLRHLRHLRHLTLLTAGLGFAALAQALPYSNLFVFGDSLSDIGNDLIVTGGTVPNTTYYSSGSTVGRFTNGLSYADHLAAGLGLALNPSELGGTDYAYGGARTSSVAVGLPVTALSFNQQIAAFNGNHAQADAGALYVLWIGANDMSDAIGAAARGNGAAVGAAISHAMQGIGGAIQNLSSRGATHFLIPNLPDLSLIPALRAFGSPPLSALAQGSSNAFNSALGSTLAQPSFAALDIRQFDVFAVQTAITANPAAYGFTNVTGACFTGNVDGQALPGGPVPTVCSDAATYMYWDFEHPTAALNTVLGAGALAAVVPEPAQWALLILGLAALGWMRRAGRRS
ncbi:SGNH/GDSL hydrolase family protein [soil metagenome]